MKENFQKNQKVFKNFFEKKEKNFKNFLKKTEEYEKVLKKMRRKTVWKCHNDMYVIHWYDFNESSSKKMKKS